MNITELKFDNKTINKLNNIQSRYEELNIICSDINTINNTNLYKELTKELSQIEEVVFKYREYTNLLKQYSETDEMISTETDPDIKEMAKSELERILTDLEKANKELRHLLIPPDPMANKNIIVEIRAGTGGDEAALFCAELFKLYTRYAEIRKWKVELIDLNETGLGGYKEIVFSISGKNVYENLRYESGGHRVQRIPQTEANGRVHTSAVTVAIMPEVEEADVEIKADDLRIDVLRASGAGGQHVNKTESAVRITHMPSGIVVKCQDNRSQVQNKSSAMKVLRSRLYERKQEELLNERSSMRKEQVGSGDRSQKIRTYSFPQNRVTDHRINMTIYNLEAFMMGDISDMLEALKINNMEERLREEN